MLFMSLLLNILLAGIAVSSVVPNAGKEIETGSRNIRRQEEEQGEDGVESKVLIEYTSQIEFAIDSHFTEIIKASEAGKFEIVITALEAIFFKFAELGDECKKGIKFEYEEIVEFAHVYIKVLIKFQAILQIIFKHPFIFNKCQSTLFKFSYQFGFIFKYLFDYKIDLKSITFSAGFDFSLFAGIGFSIPHLAVIGAA